MLPSNFTFSIPAEIDENEARSFIVKHVDLTAAIISNNIKNFTNPNIKLPKDLFLNLILN